MLVSVDISYISRSITELFLQASRRSNCSTLVRSLTAVGWPNIRCSLFDRKEKESDRTAVQVPCRTPRFMRRVRWRPIDVEHVGQITGGRIRPLGHPLHSGTAAVVIEGDLLRTSGKQIILGSVLQSRYPILSTGRTTGTINREKSSRWMTVLRAHWDSRSSCRDRILLWSALLIPQCI
jgi:hypothetical protein